LEAGRKDMATLLIAKLDRLARDPAFIANLTVAGVNFVACDQPFHKPADPAHYGSRGQGSPNEVCGQVQRDHARRHRSNSGVWSVDAGRDRQGL
jgi:hypothetical protein